MTTTDRTSMFQPVQQNPKFPELEEQTPELVGREEGL